LTSSLNFNPTARAAANWTHAELTADNLVWLRELPQGPIFPEPRPGEPQVTCVHGSPLNEDQYILNMRDAWAPLQQMTTAITFFGHTHVQGGFARDGSQWHEIHPAFRSRKDAESWSIEIPAGTRYLINPGSVGQPRDYDWRAAFAVYESGDEVSEAKLTYHRVPYDVTMSQGKILMAGLPERLAARLKEGR
jgi:diadenosine tetraphosphatase ApaH/serine/threonine PP2A family protein phosphatase